MELEQQVKLELTPVKVVHLLKYINNIDKFTLKEILGVNFWDVPEEFESIWQSFQISPFHGLCRLDYNNLNKLFVYLSINFNFINKGITTKCSL